MDLSLKNDLIMKTKKTFGEHFTIRLNRMKDGKCPVYLGIVVIVIRAEFWVKSMVAPEDWNLSKGMAKGKTESLKLLNNYLEDVRGRVYTYYRELRVEQDIVTAEAVKNAYLGIKTEANNYSLLWLAKEHNTI